MERITDCRGCRAPFVVPVDLLDIIDEGLFLLALECASCGHLAVGEVEDAELEELDHHLELTAAQMRGQADGLAAGLEPSL